MKRSKTFLRLDYSILGIHGLNSTDKIVLAYNRSFDHGSGYFASNRHAAATLCLNLKTFEKSVSKLKKLGLWKIRGQVVDVRQREGSAGTPPPGVETQPTGGENPPPREGRHPPRGVKESANLPLKNDVLLDRLLDNVLDKDNKTEPGSASEAANSKIKSNFNRDIYFRHGPEDTSGSNHDSASLDRYSRSKIPHLELSGTSSSAAGGLTKQEMIAANWEALWAGRPALYSDDSLMKADSESAYNQIDEFSRLFGTG